MLWTGSGINIATFESTLPRAAQILHISYFLSTLALRAAIFSPKYYQKINVFYHIRAPQAKFFTLLRVFSEFFLWKMHFAKDIFRFFLSPDPKYVYIGRNGSLKIFLYKIEYSYLRIKRCEDFVYKSLYKKYQTLPEALVTCVGKIFIKTWW